MPMAGKPAERWEELTAVLREATTPVNVAAVLAELETCGTGWNYEQVRIDLRQMMLRGLVFHPGHGLWQLSEKGRMSG